MLLKFAIKDFQDDREYKNLSARIIESYIMTLEEFQTYCSTNEIIIDAGDVTHSLIKNYLLYCQNERKNNATTRNSKLHILKIFLIIWRNLN